MIEGERSKMKETKQEKTKRKPKYLLFILFFFFFIGGYLFFFTSMYWMPDNGTAKRLTKLHEVIEWNQRDLSLLRWEYSEEQQLMEVELEIINKEFDPDNEYEFSAIESSGQRMKVEVVLKEPDWIILQIKDIPKRFREISLHMEMEHDENKGVVRLYTNRNDVKRVSDIHEKTRKEYRVARLKETVNGYQLSIESLEDTIVEKQQSIADITREIQRLEEKKAYQTEEELEQTELLIQDAQFDIATANDEVEQRVREIEEYKARIEKVMEQIEEVKTQP